MKGYRTLIFAVLLALAGTLELQFKLLQPYMTPGRYAVASIAIAAVVAVLRVLTNTPVFQAYLASQEAEDTQP